MSRNAKTATANAQPKLVKIHWLDDDIKAKNPVVLLKLITTASRSKVKIGQKIICLRFFIVCSIKRDKVAIFIRLITIRLKDTDKQAPKT